MSAPPDTLQGQLMSISQLISSCFHQVMGETLGGNIESSAEHQGSLPANDASSDDE